MEVYRQNGRKFQLFLHTSPEHESQADRAVTTKADEGWSDVLLVTALSCFVSGLVREIKGARKAAWVDPSHERMGCFLPHRDAPVGRIAEASGAG